MKSFIFMLITFLFVLSCNGSVNAVNKKKKKTTPAPATTQVAVPKSKKLSKYEQLFKDKSHVATDGGFMTVHKVKGKLYFELPLKYMQREMLLACAPSSSSSTTFATLGFKSNTPLHIKFVLKDSSVYMCKVNTTTTLDLKDQREQHVLRENFTDPIMEVYKIDAYNHDSTAVVFNMTPVFTGYSKLSPVTQGGGGLISKSATIKSAATKLEDIKAFEDNIVVKTLFAYDASLSFMGNTALTVPLTLEATHSLLLLPENKMRPRLSDLRMGIFLEGKVLLSDHQDGMSQYTLAHRWRLEPKDKEAYRRGELVEPVKPITYYLDPAFPELWKEAIRDAVMVWNQAFSKIGFKDAVQIKDFPMNDPSFDPENLKYSCIRYVPSSEANAMGPSWVDPSTGEIINASVLVYNNIIQLINNWRFVQTAQIDPRVRAKKMPDDIIKESLTYVIAHEIGHTLGLMHNMAASSAFPVDSLRSASFTQKYGTTPSIMDYARFYYVAQPNDKGVKLTPPDLGCYDEYAIKWLYTYFPDESDALGEAKIIEKWVDEKVGDPYFRYGRQQVDLRIDPSAIEEDLGDDPMKAGTYGIKNLKYILKNLNTWITDDDDYSHRASLYSQIRAQYLRYMMNVLYNVGGIYLTDVKEGTPGKKKCAVKRETQRASLKWLFNELKNCDWIDNKNITEKLDLSVPASSTIRSAVMKNLLASYPNVLLSASVAEKPYTGIEFFDDLYAGVWESAIQNRKVTENDRVMQEAMINNIINMANPGDRKGLFGVTSETEFAPSLDEILVYNLDETGFARYFKEELRKMEFEYGKGFVATQLGITHFGQGYKWQRKVNTSAINDAKTRNNALGLKIVNLLTQKVHTAPDRVSREHYQAMLTQLEKNLKNK